MVRSFLFALFAGTLLAGVPGPDGLTGVRAALADDDDHDEARRARQAGQVLPLDQIIGRALAAVPGEVIEVELDEDDGLYVYELKVIGRGGRLYEVEVDAATGAILKIDDD